VSSTWVGTGDLSYSALISTSRKKPRASKAHNLLFQHIIITKMFKIFNVNKSTDFAGSACNITLAIYLGICLKSLLYHCFTPNFWFRSPYWAWSCHGSMFQI